MLSGARKYLRRLTKPTRVRIILALDQFAKSDCREGGDVVRMTGLDNIFRMRVGDYRIIFEQNDIIRVLSVLKIGPRGDVYK